MIKNLGKDLLFTSEILTIDQMQVRLDDEIEDRYPIDSLAFLTYADAPDEE